MPMLHKTGPESTWVLARRLRIPLLDPEAVHANYTDQIPVLAPKRKFNIFRALLLLRGMRPIENIEEIFAS